MTITGPCAIATCQRESSTRWKKVTEHVMTKGQTNNTLPPSLQIGDTICLNCYNWIVTNTSSTSQHIQKTDSQHAHVIDLTEASETNEAKSTNELSFSEAIKILTDILFIRENREGKPTMYSFDEFRSTMEEKDVRLKAFFTELYLSSNPSSKNENSEVRVKKQLLFVCYFLCGVRNKFVNNFKRDLTIYLDSTGTTDTAINTLAELGITTTSRTVTRYKTAIAEEHANTVNSALTKCSEKALVLNIDDYHSIHTIRVPNTTTTSDAAHLATILMNPIMTRPAISRLNVHNPALVSAELIKTNIENKFMNLYGLSHNQRWGFHVVDDNAKMEELTVHSYDVRLKEKRSARSMKDVVLIDLQENGLHTLDDYVKAINTVANVPAVQQYIQKEHVIPIIADWPGQIHIRTAISRYLVHHDSSNITNTILSFLPMLGPLHVSLNSRELVFLQYRPFFAAMFVYIFGERAVLAQNPKPWHINLLLEISRSAWQEISIIVKTKFGPLCKDVEYLALKDLLDNTIPLVLDVYAVLFRSGDFNAYLESCFRVWTIFYRFRRKNYMKAPLMFLSDIFYWELNDHPILETIKAELPKFSDTPVEIFHSFLRRSTQKHLDSQQIIKYGYYINQLRLDDNGFRENFAHTSAWAAYEYSARDITVLTKKCSCFLLNCFSEIYTRLVHYKSLIPLPLQTHDAVVTLAAIKMPEARLCHLPLGFSTLHKPDPSRHCDASDCFIFLSTNAVPVEILACGHTYHKICYRNNGSKCSHCLSFLRNGVDEQVRSLLESLKNLDKKRKKRAVKEKDNIPCDDDDECKRPTKYAANSFEKALLDFQKK